MLRRDFCEWLAKMAGLCSVSRIGVSAVPLIRINTVNPNSSSNNNRSCANDVCTTQDGCSTGDAGHSCQVKDVCDIDVSRDCTNDQCESDSSGLCTNDECIEDSSGTCQADRCESDSSKDCTNDECTYDSTGICHGDRCVSDASGDCTNDGGPACQEDCPEDESMCCNDWTGIAVSDASGPCTNDGCVSDSSSDCQSDSCISDKSGTGFNDCCISDKSGSCEANDSCISDSSGACMTSDTCREDSSKMCLADDCISDSSGACEKSDICTSDSSAACPQNDNCTSDASGECSQQDSCISDYSGTCGQDRCNSDGSGSCPLDICILDLSAACTDDICREDRNMLLCETDSCALDFKNMSKRRSRRSFTQNGINQAIRWLYKISVIVLMLHLPLGFIHAQTAIDAGNAIFYPDPEFTQAAKVTALHPSGPFLRDCDQDGIMEADINGDGLCEGDPEILDYNEDGSLELPPGTEFSGQYEYTCFHIPDNVMIVTTGPLKVTATMEFVVYGAIRLTGTGKFLSVCPMDLKMSAWTGTDEICFSTSVAGEIVRNQTPVPEETPLPDMPYDSICDRECETTGVSLWMPLNEYHANDMCSCYIFVCNAEAAELSGYPLFVLLEVAGTYYFAPAFNAFGYYNEIYPVGETTIRVLPEFAWPSGTGSFSGVTWWGAMTNPQITDLFGDLDSFVFGWDTTK